MRVDGPARDLTDEGKFMGLVVPQIRSFAAAQPGWEGREMWDLRTAPGASRNAAMGTSRPGTWQSASGLGRLRGAEPRGLSHHAALLHRKLQESRGQTVAGLLAALQAKDPYTYEHSLQVADLAAAFARELRLPVREAQAVHVAALLHDIGKMGIPDAVLKKPGRLTAEEYSVMRRHSQIGASILGPIRFLEGHAVLVLHHHEWYDGRGYPVGLAGEAIPLGARIIHVADAIDAMRSPRDYKPACDRDHVRAELRQGRGRQFDPAVADVAIAWLSQDASAPALAD